MKTKRVIRLRSNSMPEQVWKRFAFTKLYLLVVSFLLVPLFLSGQTHDHSENPRHLAEDLWNSIDHTSFLNSIIFESKIPKTDISIFFDYIRSRFPDEKAEFFKKAEEGIIAQDNLKEYLESKKKFYISLYPTFVQEKENFLRELAEDNSNNILAVNGPCTNIDFESGTRNGWQGFTADACTNPNLCNRNNGFSTFRHLITNTGMTDPFIPGLSPVAPGGNHSLRLENTQNGGDAAGISQTFLVTPTNNVFTYQYAVVLEDPGDHTDPERPYFKVRMYDENNNEIACATYTALAKPPIENFTLVEVGNMDLYYRDWTTVSIPLLDYIGQNVRIEFIVSDCSRGGHLAYAYIDGKCSMLDPVTPKYICQNQNVSITATPGFAGYAWFGPGIVGPSDEQTVVVNMPGDYSITFIPISDNPCPFTVNFTVQEHCSPPPVSDHFCEELKGTGTISGINLDDYVPDILNYHSPPGIVTSWHSGFPATAANQVSSTSNLTVSNGSSYFAVISYSNLGILGGDTARLNFTVHSLPAITFPDIAEACEGSPSFQISGVSPAGGIFSGTNVTGSGVFDPVAVGTFPVKYIYTDGNGCIDSLSKPAVVRALPTSEAGPDQSLCAGVSSVSLTGSIINATGAVWSGGSGTFSPAASSLDATYIPTNAERNSGQVILTLTTTGTSPCAPVSDDVTITLIPGPIVDAGTDMSRCSATPSFNLNANFTNGNGGSWSGGSGSFSTDINDPHAVYTPDASEINTGSVTLTYSVNGNSPCTSVSDQVVLTIVPAPTADAGSPQTLCSDIISLNLSGTSANAADISWSGGAGSFSPGSNSGATVYTPTDAEKNSGSLTLTLTAGGNSPCMDVSDKVTISFVQPPSVNAGPDQSLCSDNAVFTLTGSSTNGGTVSWSGGVGNFSPDINTGDAIYAPDASEVSSGTVVLTYTASGNAPCSPVSDNVTLTIVSAPSVDAGSPQTLCADIVSLNLLGTSTNAAGVSWSGGAGSFSPGSNSEASVYTPTDTEKNSGSLTLTLTAGGNSPCVDVTDNVTISFVQPPLAEAGLDQTLCASDAVFHLTGSASNYAGKNWSGGSGTFSPSSGIAVTDYLPSPSEINAGFVVLTFTATGVTPCADVSDQVELTIAPLPQPYAGPDQIVCTGSSVNVSAQPQAGELYEWRNKQETILASGNSLTLPVPQDTLLIVVATSGQGCVSRDSIFIDAVPYPQVSVKDTSMCPGENVELQGQVLNISELQSYGPTSEWKYNNITSLVNQSTLVASKGGVFSYFVTAHTCTGSDDASVTINPVPVSHMPELVKFCPELDGQIILHAPAGYTYYWLPGGSSDQQLAVQSTGIYSVILTNQYNCTTTDEVEVAQACPPRLFVGNAFSPDGDNVNDHYEVHSAHIGKFHMLVFNRWGEVIFESNEHTLFWDGFYRGEPMPIGVYPWVITYEGDSEEYKGPYKQEGSVTIVR